MAIDITLAGLSQVEIEELAIEALKSRKATAETKARLEALSLSLMAEETYREEDELPELDLSPDFICRLTEDE